MNYEKYIPKIKCPNKNDYFNLEETIYHDSVLVKKNIIFNKQLYDNDLKNYLHEENKLIVEYYNDFNKIYNIKKVYTSISELSDKQIFDFHFIISLHKNDKLLLQKEKINESYSNPY